MVARDIRLAEALGTRVHIAHLSVRGAVRAVAEARERGARVSAEATPHHLLLDDSLLESRDASFKMNPPLRSARDVAALVQAVREGVVDVIATDHAPHAEEDKAAGIEKAAFGVVGLETAVPVLLDRLVRPNTISLSRFIALLSLNPARLLGFGSKGRIAVGADADLTLLDLDAETVVDRTRFESRSRNTPFNGWVLRGAPAMTIVGGRVVYPFNRPMKMKLERVEKKLGYVFKDGKLLEKALTHSSSAFERPGAKDNELLEFLGDSVVGLAVAHHFYAAYPGLAEGELSKLKSTASSTLSLSDFARKLKLDKALLLGRGEEKSGGRKKRTILAGVFESVVGAVYLDGGFEEARSFVVRVLESSFRPIREEFLINNFKSALQETFQKDGLPSPSYRTLTEKGPDHEKTFVVEVCAGDRVLAKSKGRSRKSAEQAAAQKALKSILGRKMKVLTPESFIVAKKG